MTLDRVSYSSLIQFKSCSHQFKLNNIDKVGKFDSTIHTIFGKWIHTGVQTILEKKGDESRQIQNFSKRWKNFSRVYKDQLVHETTRVESFALAGIHILKHIKSAMDLEFKNWSVVSIEQRLKTPELYEKGKYFKGFIDIVLKYE